MVHFNCQDCTSGEITLGQIPKEGQVRLGWPVDNVRGAYLDYVNCGKTQLPVGTSSGFQFWTAECCRKRAG